MNLRDDEYRVMEQALHSHEDAWARLSSILQERLGPTAAVEIIVLAFTGKTPRQLAEDLGVLEPAPECEKARTGDG